MFWNLLLLIHPCYIDWMIVFLQISYVDTKFPLWWCLEMTLGGGGRWLAWAWSSHERDLCLNKRHPRKLPCPFCHVRGTLIKHWILDFLVSGIMSNKFLLFINDPVYSAIIIALLRANLRQSLIDLSWVWLLAHRLASVLNIGASQDSVWCQTLTSLYPCCLGH